MLDEFQEDVTFLSYGIIYNDLTDLHTRYVEAFYQEGFVTQEQVSKVLGVQVEENVLTEKHRATGKIMVDMGFMNTSQVDEVLEQMSKKTT